MNKICRALVIALLLSHRSAAINAAPVIPNAGLIMRESSKMPTMPKKPIDIQIEQPPLKKPMAAQSNLHVLVKSFNFSGNSQFPASTLQPLLSRYTNRELSFADLQQAAAVITEYYRKAGFLFAYTYLPEQTLEHGQVELAIFEGQLDDKHFEK
jgi:hemolysin activation/secretion protein